MTADYVLTLGQNALKTALMVGAPMILGGMAVGIVIALFQAATQINEQSLNFVPKILVSIAALFLFGPWMLQTIVSFFQQMVALFPQLVR